MAKYRLFCQIVCRKCGQDVENHGRSQWLDRGGNRECVPMIQRGEIVQPKKGQKHTPVQISTRHSVNY